ncbi:MAG: hypothetical protein QOG65_2366, partial [Actinomycetota bacterium]|nr:hypothetical protein [Actinomycetota bacterium]
GAADVFVKIRVSSCGCRPPATDGELLPSEIAALNATAHALVPTVQS